MQAAGTRQAGLVGGVKAAGTLMAEQRAGMVEAQIAGKPLRADAGPAGEQPLEMERAEIGRGGDLVERRRIAVMRRDLGDGGLDPPIVKTGPVGTGVVGTRVFGTSVVGTGGVGTGVGLHRGLLPGRNRQAPLSGKNNGR